MLSQPKQRAVDLLLVSQYLVLILVGYLSGRNHEMRNAFYPCMLPVLMLASFVAVFYPFRIFTRALWLLLGPLSVWFAALFGTILFVRLNTAPGFDHTIYYTGQLVSYIIPATVFIFLLPLLVWFVIYLLGWRLRQDGQEVPSRTIQLKELMALTGLVGATTVLAQNSVPPGQLAAGKELLLTQHQVLLFYAAIESFFLVPIILAAFSRSHLLAIAACLLYVAISFAADHYYSLLGTQPGYRASFVSNWPLYFFLPSPGFRIVGSIMLCFVVCVSRACGFRLVRVASEPKSIVG